MSGGAGTSRARSAIAMIVMLAGVLVTYRSPETFAGGGGGWRIAGADYNLLHLRRIEFALESLREHGTIPAWYPRELLGTPFWSNVQNFPFIPTRLATFWTGPENAFTLGVWMSAGVAAAFTFLWLRRVGVGPIGAAAAGWTFACAGFFVSRVTAGHLPLLEAYPALPLLLWAIEGLRHSAAAAADRKRMSVNFAIAAAAVVSVLLAGHPQVPLYALAAAAAYLFVRLRGRAIIAGIAAAILGAGAAAFALWPMALLVARSTRVLPLDRAANDLPLPYWRLKALLFPWADGAPQPLQVEGVDLFMHRSQYFWDTVTYVGWMPLLAMVAVIAWLVIRRRSTSVAPIATVLLIGLIGVALSLPWTRAIGGEAGGTFLRSPSRLTYLFTFAAAAALGATIERILSTWRRRPSGRIAPAALVLVAAVVAWHAIDLYAHARPFVRPWQARAALEPEVERALREDVGDGRIGIDGKSGLAINRRLDDVGFFDSIMLANVYRGIIDFADLPPDTNEQQFDAGRVTTRGLAACAARMLLTEVPRTMSPIAEWGSMRLYRIPEPADRATFFPASAAVYATAEETAAMRRDRSVDLAKTLVLPASARSEAVNSAGSGDARVRYERPNPDRIGVTVDAASPGFVRVVEAHDVGWRAAVNGAPVAILPAHGMVMAVPVPAGRSEVVLEYFTPGRNAGLAISAVSLLLIGSTAWWLSRGSNGLHPAGGEERADDRGDAIA